VAATASSVGEKWSRLRFLQRKLAQPAGSLEVWEHGDMQRSYERPRENRFERVRDD
jgi:hypothetical protein